MSKKKIKVKQSPADSAVVRVCSIDRSKCAESIPQTAETGKQSPALIVVGWVLVYIGLIVLIAVVLMQ